MFFEGTEKKIELIIRGANLRAKPESFWLGMVQAANAKIISKMSNEACDAYLLSESSLFVWNERLTMITCGTTTLVNAADYFFDRIPASEVDYFIYVRKNEYFPAAQATDFSKDADLLSRRVPGKVYSYGSTNEHRMSVYHLDKEFVPGAADGTLEVLMHNCESKSTQRLRELCRLEEIFPNFKIDDFVFDPKGYSLNAIRGSRYFTIHVTPEESNAYISFVTNVELGARAPGVIQELRTMFRPKTFDVVSFGGFETGFAHHKDLPLEG